METDRALSGPLAGTLFRVALAAAGCYNAAFGIWAVLWPHGFFYLFDVPAPRYPAIWSCVGMVVGVYGLLYWYAAWRPDRGRPIVAVGLLGKVLGPIGMLASFGEDWPLRLGMLSVFNDVIWWLPFALFLLRGTRFAAPVVRSAPFACAALHALALLALALMLREGMLTEPATVERARYVAEHPGRWAGGWSVWMLAALSLVGFYAWWGARLPPSPAVTAAVLVAAAGMVLDLTGESLSSLVLVEQARSALNTVGALGVAGATGGAGAEPALLAQFAASERWATLLTAAGANTLYTVAGVLLTLKTRHLPLWVLGSMVVIWSVGAAMTIGAILGHVNTMVATSAVLFPLLVLFALWMGSRWKHRP